MRFFLCTLLAIFSCLELNAQNNRLALVIGIENYSHVKLHHPVNNATDVSTKLAELGFKVLSYTNLDQKSLKSAIDEFGNELMSFDVGLVYYSGLAVQSKGLNYLVPLGVEAKTENDIEYNCVSAGRILGKMEDAGTKTNIIILDASADNLFERSWTQAVKGRGLAFMDAPVGSLIAYSTSPGRITKEWDGRNSIYTSAFLDNMNEPNTSIEDVFKKVRVNVKEKSKNRQIPWESTSMEGDFYFKIDENFNKLTVTGIHTKAEKNNMPERELKNRFTDARDGQEYEWVKIENQIWMAENMNFEIVDHSWCYENLKRNCESYGRLYTFQAAKEACPAGWHLPSDEEWKMLEINLGMSRTEADKRAVERGTIEGGKLKSGSDLWEQPNNGATNETKFNALPGGFRDEAGIFDAMAKWAWFWSSTEQTNVCAWSRVLLYDYASIERWNIVGGFGQSVRCIKDETE